MTHKVEIGDIWESNVLFHVMYLILEVEGKKVYILNLIKNEITFVYSDFFIDSEYYKWRKAA